MSAIIQPIQASSIQDDIEMHPAWLGRISGLIAEKMLRKKAPYLYVLREGENQNDYYITFVDADGTVKHQPFVITDTMEGWYYENGGGGGPFKNIAIDDVLHLIMHCGKDEPHPSTQG